MRASLLVLTVLLFIGCKKTDNIRPNINNVNMNGFNNAVVTRGAAELRYNFDLSDNEELNKLSVTCFKGYFGEKEPIRTSSDIQYTNIFSLDGTKENGTDVIPIVNGLASGSYRLEFEAADKAGNLSFKRYVNFVYQDNEVGSRPDLVIFNTTPALINNQITITRGNEIEIDGEAYANVDLSRIRVELITSTESVLRIDKLLPEGNNTIFNFDNFTNDIGQPLPILIPVTLAPGSYPMLISAFDANDRAAIIQIIVNVIA
ncbi:MAG: hypothetical protein ACPF8V_10220 [Luteibaculum sp.]